MSLGAKIRSRRRLLGLTLEEVAQAADLSKPFLSQVERDKASPSLTSLTRIAGALQVSTPYFVSPPLPDGAVQRSGERRYFSVGTAQKQFASLTGHSPDRSLEVLLTRLAPGLVSEMTTHAGEEFFYVLEGCLHLAIEGQEFDMEPGDSVHYRSTAPHLWENRSDRETVLLWVGTPTLF